jgi:prepilin-type N-terminal cleavage/methylation domain-containing protein
MPTPAHPRRGFTLVELLVVIVLLGIVGGTITTLVVRQQRFYRGASEIIDTRSQLRQAASILPTDLRGLSSIGGDIVTLAPQQLEFRAPIGTSIVCERSGNTVTLPPAVLASGTVLTSFLNTPGAGDVAFVYDDQDASIGSDDQWVPLTVSSVVSPGGTTGCPTATGFTQTGDAAQPRMQVTFGGTLPATVIAGAPMRFTRRVRYSLYRASDNLWYLGYEQQVNGSWTGVQPVSGPYLAGDAAAVGDRGLQFRLFNEAGTEVTSLAAATTVARVDIVVRGQSRQPVQLSGTAPTQLFRDSLNVSVAIRNRQ